MAALRMSNEGIRMKRTVKALHCAARCSIVLSLMLGTLAAMADPTVDLTVTPLGGGIFQYQFSVNNSGPQDISIVTITDAPGADPLIPLTLTAPVGFLANYDPGLGLVDFLEGTSSFQVGTTISGFGFESATSPDANFLAFEALSVNGDFFAGTVHQVTSTVPEGGRTVVLTGLAFMGLIVARSRFSLQSK